MAFFKRKMTDSKELAAKKETKRSKGRMDDFQEKVSVPLHLSLPFYVIAVFLLLLGLFIILHWGIGTYIADPTGGGFVTTARKSFGPMDNMNHVRWKYYIPLAIFSKHLINGFIMAGIGLSLIVMNKTLSVRYAKKKVAAELEDKKKK